MEEIQSSLLYKYSAMERFLYTVLLISEDPLGAQLREAHQGVLDGFKLPQMSSLLEASSGKPELLPLSIASKRGFFILSTNFANKCGLTAAFRMLIAFIPGFRIPVPKGTLSELLQLQLLAVLSSLLIFKYRDYLT